MLVGLWSRKLRDWGSRRGFDMRHSHGCRRQGLFPGGLRLLEWSLSLQGRLRCLNLQSSMRVSSSLRLKGNLRLRRL